MIGQPAAPDFAASVSAGTVIIEATPIEGCNRALAGDYSWFGK
jgi:hypothetical protein